MRLKLPFVYEMNGLLRKKRGRQALLVRDHIVVDIGQADNTDIQLALVTLQAGRTRRLYSHKGRLYVCAEDTMTKPIRADDFERLVYQTERTFGADWNAMDFPCPSKPHVRGMITNALDCHQYGHELIWRSAPESSRLSREAQAAGFYPAAFLELGGNMLMQFHEPVWHADHIGRNKWEIHLVSAPYNFEAAVQFPVRELASAERFVTEGLGGRLAPVLDRATVLSEGALCRTSFQDLSSHAAEYLGSTEQQEVGWELEADMKPSLARMIFEEHLEGFSAELPSTDFDLLRKRWLFELERPEARAIWQRAIDDDPDLADI